MDVAERSKIRVRNTSKEGASEVFDPIRKQWVAYTPEEHVRQLFIWFLINEKQVPPAYISVEHAFVVAGKRFRADIVVFGKTARPLMLVECKASEVAIDREVLDQCSRYNVHICSPYVVATNLTKTFCFHTSDFLHYTQCDTMPDYTDLVALVSV